MINNSTKKIKIDSAKKVASKKSLKERNSNSKIDIKGYGVLFSIIVLLLIDRITKIWAVQLSDTIDLKILEFTYVVNTGAGFSIFNNTNTALAIITTIIALILIYFYNTHNKFDKSFSIPKFSFIMILSGTIGNIIDRIFNGGVIDFINFKFWPVFNVADSLIFIGVVYWIIILLKEK